MIAESNGVAGCILNALFTILGGVIGAIVADRVARIGEFKRDRSKAFYEFDVAATKILYEIAKTTDLWEIFRRTLPELETLRFRAAYFLSDADKRSLTELWNRYSGITREQLEGVQRTPTGGRITQAIDQRTDVIARPLREIQELLRNSTYLPPYFLFFVGKQMGP